MSENKSCATVMEYEILKERKQIDHEKKIKEIQEKESQEIFAPYQNSLGSVPEETRLHAFIRRTIDIVLSVIVLILTIPVMIIIAILIRLDSPGPALFWQIRMTKCRRDKITQKYLQCTDKNDPDCRRKNAMAGRPFKFVKFRTMYVDARERFPCLYEYKYTNDEIARMKFKVYGDPRVTRIGHFLRKTSLDELPNFWNVFIGDMTLSGPRPEIPEMSPYYTDEQLKKFRVAAGITGPAQIGGRGDLSFQDTINLDASYAVNRTLKGDSKIIWKTVLAVIKSRGAF